MLLLAYLAKTLEEKLKVQNREEKVVKIEGRGGSKGKRLTKPRGTVLGRFLH